MLEISEISTPALTNYPWGAGELAVRIEGIVG